MKSHIITFTLCLLTLSAFAQRGIIKNNGKDISPYVTKMGQTYYYLNNFYLDTVNFNNITDKVLINIVKELDPHSAYISLKDVQAMNEPLEGNFSGVGVEFALINDTLTIQATVPGGPSEKVGIRAGDKIIKVDGEIISGTQLTIPRVHKYLRGVKGTKVNVAIQRKEEKELIDFTITRDKIPITSLDAYYQVEPGIMYMHLSRFAATSYKEIMTAISEMKGKPNGIILDLRGNSGGYLIAALQIANEFLNNGELILYTEGRTVQRMDEYANGGGILKDIPVAILIDENSASASEIVSGAIQDWDRGTIIGRRSFGKGLVQQQLPLSDGSQLRLTVARYHTPSGRVIQSHYEQGKTEEYYKQLFDRYARGEQYSKDSIQFPDSLKYKTLKLGRTVYGGGGIMPDIFIPQDTSFYTPFYGQILRKGLLTDYVNEYIDNNREKLSSKYKNFAQFEKSYIVPDKVYTSFLAYCKEKGVEPKENQLETSTPELKKYFKGLIIRSLYGFNSYFEYINKDDKEVLEAIKALK
ncbi:MAG: S41 family peptidase [Bacteroidales bacterium]